MYDKVNEFVENQDLYHDITRQYIVRCAFNAINNYSEMNRSERLECKQQYFVLKNSIIKNQAFMSRALRARCYGRLPWVFARCLEKMGI